jgi:hypothetical protein
MPKRWDPWTLHRDGKSLRLRDKGGAVYWVDLTTIRSRAQMRERLNLVRKKIWATEDILINLLDAFLEILTPQVTLSPGRHPGGDQRQPADFSSI